MLSEWMGHCGGRGWGDGYLYNLSVSCTIRDTMGFDAALRCSLQSMGKRMMREKGGRSGQRPMAQAD